jgi:shikimate dehydrogenase
MPRLAVVGHPVAHSRSPAMQTAALEAVGLAGEWGYEAIDVEPGRFAELVGGMPAAGFAGINVTIPHKAAALELADEASLRAREIGAANTLTFTEGGVEAENTDAIGIMAAIDAEIGGRALVLGAGGSARAAIWAMREAGLDVSIWNRTPERAQAVAEELGAGLAGSTPDIASFDVIVNATPIGLEDGAGNETAGPSGVSTLKGLPLAADALTDRQVVVDLAYGSVETPVIAAARAAGARWIDGLEVLVRQGAEAFRIWTGIDPPLDVMRRAARAGSPDNDERAPDTPLSGPRPGG